jgi:hypothetical protein
VPTTTINALRKPSVDDSPNGPQQISNLADDVDRRLVAVFATTTARDAAITSPTDGMLCYVEADDLFYARIKGAWRVSSAGNTRYYSAGTNSAFTITTTPTAPTNAAAVALPAGTFDFDVRGLFVLSPSTVGRELSLHLYSGATALFETMFTVNTVGGVSTRNHADFTRLTLAAAATVSVRVSANAVGGTQNFTSNAIRAVRVSG